MDVWTIEDMALKRDRLARRIAEAWCSGLEPTEDDRRLYLEAATAVQDAQRLALAGC